MSGVTLDILIESALLQRPPIISSVSDSKRRAIAGRSLTGSAPTFPKIVMKRCWVRPLPN